MPVQPGTSSDMTAEEEKLLSENPQVHSILNKLLDQRLKDILPQLGTGNVKQKTNDMIKVNQQKQSASTNRNVLKSPSDITIYAPALKLQAKQQVDQFMPTSNQIDAFVGAVRKEVQSCDNPTNQRVVTSVNDEARKKAEHTIIEVEKFRANIATPPEGTCTNGLLNDQIANLAVSSHPTHHNLESEINASEHFQMGNMMVSNEILPQTNQQVINPQAIAIPNIGAGVSDDDFFHLTCYLEPSLIHKIEKGEFIELEKLLPKDRSSFTRGGNDESRFKWVQRDGNTYLVAANRDSKITGIRCWEQAFRVYATIYCVANPQRAKEIWQYISVINTAASSYAWDNVYNYDITFRHLMAFNPNRSWAVTYNKMWNLSMRDPLPRNQNNRGSFQFHRNNGSGHSNAQGQNQMAGNGQHKKKSDYCWNFNKGVPCKFGKKCRFIERCRYCDSPAHGIHVCPKLEQKKQGEGSTPDAHK